MKLRKLNVIYNVETPEEIEDLKQRGFEEVKPLNVETPEEIEGEPKTKKGKKGD